MHDHDIIACSYMDANNDLMLLYVLYDELDAAYK